VDVQVVGLSRLAPDVKAATSFDANGVVDFVVTSHQTVEVGVE